MPCMDATNRETWLNGWKREGIYVQMGTGLHCGGCGKCLGVVSAIVPEGWESPPTPEWPFNEADCPVCREFRGAKSRV